jgi:hypothetical protein
MQDLKTYLRDGAGHQARAVLAILQESADIEDSWDDTYKEYCAKPKVARWENCREQGYIVSLRSKNYGKQLNIAFFEHRNSDSICAVRWEQYAINSITISNAKFGDIYRDKHDVSFMVEYGEIVEMAEWIERQLADFWITTKGVNRANNTR